jgi:hypothetical protein
MKTQIKKLFLVLVLWNTTLAAYAQGTAFTYQGRLNQNGSPANGVFDFKFALASGPVIPPDSRTFTTNSAVAVSNGLFVVMLDFGAMSGQPYWLDLAVKPASDPNPFVALNPRQQLTPTPYANFALQAGYYGGAIADSQLSASIANWGPNQTFLSTVNFNPGGRPPGPPFTVGNSILITNLNADFLDGLDASSFWRTDGNVGTFAGAHFLGTTDNQPLELKVNNQRGLRLEPTGSNDTVNVIGGSARNFVGPGVVGASIGGGGAGNYFGGAYTNQVEADFGTVSGGLQNTSSGAAASVGGGELNVSSGFVSTVSGGGYNVSSAIFSTVGGGVHNTASGEDSTVAGGNLNSSSNAYATVGGGAFNVSGGYSATVSGGSGNTSSGGGATIGGGDLNTGSGLYATIPGGRENNATNYAFAAGHRAKANHTGAFVWADSAEADFASTAANQFSVRATGGVRLSDSTPNLSFGSSVRQMLNLWGTEYGIGVQSSTVYFRTHDASGAENGFAWYKGGTHNSAAQNAGGGTTMMRLDGAGLTVNGVFISSSDRNLKAGFEVINAKAILEKVAALPVMRWHFTNNIATSHVGPMAQDFHAAFGLGADDKHIATVDADGVALAAIQGLNLKLETEVKSKDARINELEKRLSAIEILLNK